MTRRSPDVTRPNPSQPNRRLTRCQIQDFKHKLARAVRVMAPTLIALTFASAAHAQGTMDFSSATTLMGTFNTRFAYVSVSRASEDARIYTNDATTLAERLSIDISKASAVEVARPNSGAQAHQHRHYAPIQTFTGVVTTW